MALSVGVDTNDGLHAVDTTTKLHLSLCGQLPHRHVYEWAWHDHLDDPRPHCAICDRRAAQLAGEG